MCVSKISRPSVVTSKGFLFLCTSKAKPAFERTVDCLRTYQLYLVTDDAFLDDQFYYKAFVSTAVCRPLPKFKSLGVLGVLGGLGGGHCGQVEAAIRGRCFDFVIENSWEVYGTTSWGGTCHSFVFQRGTGDQTCFVPRRSNLSAAAAEECRVPRSCYRGRRQSFTMFYNALHFRGFQAIGSHGSPYSQNLRQVSTSVYVSWAQKARGSQGVHYVELVEYFK